MFLIPTNCPVLFHLGTLSFASRSMEQRVWIRDHYLVNSLIIQSQCQNLVK